MTHTYTIVSSDVKWQTAMIDFLANHKVEPDSTVVHFREGDGMEEVEKLRQRVADMKALLRQFGDIGIPDNWPGHCKLRIDTGRDGHEHISYHGVPEQHLGILPQLCYWRQAREAAGGDQ